MGQYLESTTHAAMKAPLRRGPAFPGDQFRHFVASRRPPFRQMGRVVSDSQSVFLFVKSQTPKYRRLHAREPTRVFGLRLVVRRNQRAMSIEVISRPFCIGSASAPLRLADS